MPKPRSTTTFTGSDSERILALLQKAMRSQNDDSKQILTVLQNLFILEATRSGMSVGEIRKVLKIQKNRVSSVTKHIKLASASTDKK